MSPEPVTRRTASGPTARLPRARVDPIDHEATAVSLLQALVGEPRRHETIMVLLDRCRRGTSIVVVDGTVDPDDVVRSVEVVAMAMAAHTDEQPASAGPASDSRITGIIVASVRPDDPTGFDDLLDADRWLHLDEITALHGIELVEWLVLAGADDSRISRPRELLDESPRWSPTRPHGAAPSA